MANDLHWPPFWGRSVEKGLALQRRAATQGFRPAEVALADRYAAGYLVARDDAEAFLGT